MGCRALSVVPQSRCSQIPQGRGPDTAKEEMHENKPPLVTNPRDPRFLALRSLQTSQGRSRTNLYLIEGIRHLARAVEELAPIESVFFDPSVLSNPFGRKLIRRLLHSRLPAIRLSPQLYRELTLATEPQGLGAVLRQQYVLLEDISQSAVKGTSSKPALSEQSGSKGACPGRAKLVEREGTAFSRAGQRKNKLAALAAEGIYLAVESIDSPGNLGTIIRTAEAAGVNAIFLLGSDDDPWNPAAVRASMGSLFSQTLVKCTPQEFTAWARAQGVATVASSPNGLLDYKALRLRGPVALLIGSEKRGLSPHLLEASDFAVRIPMRGRCDSVNVAVATGVLLFEMARP